MLLFHGHVGVWVVALRAGLCGLAGLESMTGVSRAATVGGSPSQTPVGGDIHLPRREVPGSPSCWAA